ncbi:hypothetical protein ACLKA6_013953 [Drosophila palustris]
MEQLIREASVHVDCYGGSHRSRRNIASTYTLWKVLSSKPATQHVRGRFPPHLVGVRLFEQVGISWLGVSFGQSLRAPEQSQCSSVSEGLAQNRSTVPTLLSCSYELGSTENGTILLFEELKDIYVRVLFHFGEVI